MSEAASETGLSFNLIIAPLATIHFVFSQDYFNKFADKHLHIKTSDEVDEVSTVLRSFSSPSSSS